MDFNENKFLELSESDSSEINGGNAIAVIMGIGAVYCTCDMVYQFYKGYKAGWKAGGRK